MGDISRIFIVGQSGAGKGLLAKEIAKKLGWEFINLDFGIEFEIGASWQDIIGPAGEQQLSICHKKILEGQLQKNNFVATTDTSIVNSVELLDMLRNEFVVHLKVSISTQLSRASRKPDYLIPNVDMHDFCESLHMKYDHLFDEVESVSLSSDDNKINEHVNFVIDAIKNDASIQNKNYLGKKDLIFFHRTTYEPHTLSEKQAQCYKYLARGMSFKEIARELDISHRTVEEHIANIMKLMGCSTSKELIALYYENP